MMSKSLFRFASLLLMSTTASAQAAEVCRPACRSGYVCVEGACVSACNPPCGPGERCTDDGECVPGSAAAPGEPDEPREVLWPNRDLQTILYLAPAFVIDWVEPDFEGPAMSAALGVRLSFTRVLSWQARASFLAGYTGGKDAAEIEENQDQEMKFGGLLLGLRAETTLRIGPVAPQFPWYCGAGVWLGLVVKRGTTRNWDFEDQEVRERSSSAIVPAFGGVAETGFTFGKKQDIDIALKMSVGTNFGIDGAILTPMVVVGFAL